VSADKVDEADAPAPEPDIALESVAVPAIGGAPATTVNGQAGRPPPAPVTGAAPKLVPAGNADNAKLAGATVLLVDDDMRNTFALSSALRGRGLKVLMAGDGAKALDQLEANDSVNVVLMDIMMPGMDGFETIHRLRAQPRYALLPIIALTAKVLADDKAQCLAAGASAYLPKPLDIDALTHTISALL
jgi:CheY-like chemotaxis protein